VTGLERAVGTCRAVAELWWFSARSDAYLDRIADLWLFSDLCDPREQPQLGYWP
jgi:hypothetical protein